MSDSMNYKTNRNSLAPYVRGVVGPVDGQEDDFCGVGACGAFKDMLINALTPLRYSKVGLFGTAAPGVDIQFAKQTVTAFGYVQDDLVPGMGAIVATASHTNLSRPENPVPKNGGFLFCVVGLTADVERPYASDAEFQSYPQMIGEAPDYREAIRESIINNASLQFKYGNNGCTYDINLLKHNPGPNAAVGSDKIGTGQIAAPLLFNPLNSVVCVDSLDNNRRCTMDLNLGQSLKFLQTSLAITAATVRVPVEITWFGFVILAPNGSQVFMPGPTGPIVPANFPGNPGTGLVGTLSHQ